MPRTLKRRSEAVTDNVSPSESPEPATRRRRRSSSASSEASNISASPDVATQAEAQSQSNTQILIKKLVRLALSTEYARLPLRRSDISQKILKDNNASYKLFKPVFNGAVKVLQHTFGMTLVELPSREKTTLKDRRAQATQTQKSQSAAASNKSWILVSTLPKAYQQNPEVCPPTRASSQETESQYTALYTFVLALIYLNNSVLTEAKLERYMKRVNADNYTPAGATDKLLQRMVKEGYVEKRRDISSGEEVVEWVIGPRGKVEVGVRGIANLVKGVYGFGAKQQQDDAEHSDREDAEEETESASKVKIEEDELNRKIERSLGINVSEEDGAQQQQVDQMEVDNEQPNGERPKRGRPRRNRGDSEDD